VSAFAEEIFGWECENFLDARFSYDEVATSPDGVVMAILHLKNQFYKSNVARRLLERGYAVLSSSVSKEQCQTLMEYQQAARKDSVGMWSSGLGMMLIGKQQQDRDVPRLLEQPTAIVTYERPHLPLLGIGIAALGSDRVPPPHSL
jgi:hypothetical protein